MCIRDRLKAILLINIETKADKIPIGTAMAKAALASTVCIVANVTAKTVAAAGSAEICPPILDVYKRQGLHS